jgi:hypothetical protein
MRSVAGLARRSQSVNRKAGSLVKRISLGIAGCVLVTVSLVLGYAELGHALQGSSGAWIAFAVLVLVCSAVIGAPLVKAAIRLQGDGPEPRQRL